MNFDSGKRPNADAITTWMVSRLAKELELAEDEISLDTPFTSLGLSSRQAVALTGELEEFLGVAEIDPSLLWDYPTIAKVAQHLSTL
jgi:acyl carrier protein